MNPKSPIALGLALITIGISLSGLTKFVSAQEVVSIKSFNYPDLYIRHKNFLGYLENANDELAAKDSSFKLVPGLANKKCSSLESVNFPGYFLRHENFRIKLSPKINTALFQKDATFCLRRGVFGQQGVSFESMNMPGHFIRHKNFELWIDPSNGTDLFRKDATFSFTNSLAL